MNNYKNPKYTLNYASADATAFKDAMENGSKEIFSKTSVTFLSDAQAGKDNIVAALNKVKENRGATGYVCFYYAGHGVISDAKEFFLVPYDVLQLYGNDDALAQKASAQNNCRNSPKK